MTRSVVRTSSWKACAASALAAGVVVASVSLARADCDDPKRHVMLGSQRTSQARYADAEREIQTAMTIAEAQKNGPALANALNALGRLYRELGRYREAEPLHRRALATFERAGAPEIPSVAATLDSLAALYREQGRYGEAESLYRRAQFVREQNPRTDPVAKASGFAGLAGVYRARARYAEAETLQLKAIDLLERAPRAEGSLGWSLFGLASVRRDQGRLAEAEPLYQRAVSLFEKTSGAEHSSVAWGLNGLGMLYTDAGGTPRPSHSSSGP